MIMDTPIEEKKQIEMAANRETTGTEVERLVEDGFTSEEITALMWLQQSYQAGGSDRIELVRRWEFLKYLVLTGKLEEAFQHD